MTSSTTPYFIPSILRNSLLKAYAFSSPFWECFLFQCSRASGYSNESSWVLSL